MHGLSSLTMLRQRAEPEGAACGLRGPELLQAPGAGCVLLGQGRSSELCSHPPHVPHGSGRACRELTPAVRLCSELQPRTWPKVGLGWCGVAGWGSLDLRTLAVTPGSTRRCAAAAPDCCFLSKRERKSISAKSRLGLCLKPLSKEPFLNVIAPLLLQGENTLYCSLFLGKLS